MLTKSELKAWTDALRGGEYIQGSEYLKCVDMEGGEIKHCCLGVLCEIQGLHQQQDTCGVFYFTDKNGDSSSGILPNEMFHKLGMMNTGCFLGVNMPELKSNTCLAMANDNGVSFSEIADHLDKYYPATED